MSDENTNVSERAGRPSSTMRDLLAIGFRRKRLMVNTFLALFSLGVLIAFLLPKKYESQMKILVRHERAEDVVTPEREPPVEFRTGVAPEELQSEAELLKSRDLLEKVVIACDLQKFHDAPWWSAMLDDIRLRLMASKYQGDPGVPLAVLELEKNLDVAPVKLTNLISVSYASTDPQRSARVLNTLANLYLEKHLEMHHLSGEFDFFHQQAEEYRQALANGESQLTELTRTDGVIAPSLEKEIAVRKLADSEATAKDTQTAMGEVRQRIRTMEAQLATLPARQTAQVRTADNPQLMQNLKSTLLDLELKRTDLLSKFAPTYRPVQEIEAQIAETKQAIDAAENAPLRDETTDRDPTYENLRGDLSKAKTELAALEARAAGTAHMIDGYHAEAERLDQEEARQRDVLRANKANEDNYLLYLRKQEEARISDALDRQRIANVVVAEPAAVPFQARGHRLTIIAGGAFFAAFISVALAFVLDYWDPSFRTPEELQSFLGSPILAAFPKSNP